MEMNDKKISTDRVEVLDALKGVCILMVIAVHYDWDDGQRRYGVCSF